MHIPSNDARAIRQRRLRRNIIQPVAEHRERG
jgi:hypothetical protein